MIQVSLSKNKIINILIMIFKLFQKYSDSSTCHGIKYIGRKNFFVPERVFWFFATFLFIGLAGVVALELWVKFSSKPIEISVETTTFPLAEIPFPAITICPQNQINVSIAVKYLSRFISVPLRLKYKIIKQVLAALYSLKFPNYIQMKDYLKTNKKHLKQFDYMNMTDFMLAVLPSCSEILRECLWHGRSVNCCEIFTLQRTEEGFCYSFNSLTTDNKKTCYFDSLIRNGGIGNEQDQSCIPRFLTFSGVYSGLTIFANPQVENKFLPVKHLTGFMVLLSTAYDYPQAGSGTLLRTLPGESLEIEVSPSMLHSTKKLSRVAAGGRQCILNFERDLFAKYYSEHSCRIDCRGKFIMRLCGCQLYFFYDPEVSSVPLCQFSQLTCITKYASALTMKSPSIYALNKPIIKDFPDCNCKAACESFWFDLVIKRKNVSELMGMNVTGHLSIFYGKYGAIKYERKLAFSIEKLIVSLGGVVNLFLGASFISVSEILYYFTRSVCIMIYMRIVKSAEPNIVQIMYSSSNNNQGFHQRLPHKRTISLVEKKYTKQYKKLQSITLLREFTQNSTIHGVQHIFRENETPLHRFIWTIFFSVCLSGATYLIYDSWSGYITVPFVISVINTNYPLDGIYFPAVSVCPAQKIVTVKAMEFLATKVDNKTLNDPRINDFLKALTALQHPLYYPVSLYLNKSVGLLKVLESVNITELMIKSLPSCEEIFLRCYWQGLPRNCCSIFSLQRSEEGFCYSFNSFTSEKYKNCIYKDKGINAEKCKLLTTSNIGPRSAIEILIKPSKLSDSSFVYSNSKVMNTKDLVCLNTAPTKECPNLSWLWPCKIQVHHPNEYPESGMGSLVPIGNLDKMNIGVKPIITESSDDIRSLSPEISGCYFKDSKQSFTTRIYSQKSCLLECRMNFIIRKCRCIPYYITMQHYNKNCNSTELLCMVAHIEELRFYRPPSASKVSYDDKNSLDCTHCLPTCNERQYEVVIDLTEDTSFRKHKSDGYVDIFYKYSGAVRYNRDMSYDFIQLLVDLGGIGGLFLGGSLLSLLEAVYWFSKAFITFMWPIEDKKVHIKEAIIQNQGWLN